MIYGQLKSLLILFVVCLGLLAIGGVQAEDTYGAYPRQPTVPPVIQTTVSTIAGQIAYSTSMIIRSGDATDPWKPCWTHYNWGNPIGDPEAKWTWATYQVSNPEGGENQTYTRGFNIDGIPNSGKLTITADNSYTAVLNGQELGTGNDYRYAQTYDLLGKLKEGENALTINVTNAPMSGGNVETNPAGLLYNFEVSWDEADVLPTSDSDYYEIFVRSENGELIPDAKVWIAYLGESQSVGKTDENGYIHVDVADFKPGRYSAVAHSHFGCLIPPNEAGELVFSHGRWGQSTVSFDGRGGYAGTIYVRSCGLIESGMEMISEIIDNSVATRILRLQ